MGFFRSMAATSSPVTSDPGILGGTLVFRGTRVPVQTLLDYLSDGFGIDEFLDFFPSVRKEDVVEFLDQIDRKAS